MKQSKTKLVSAITVSIFTKTSELSAINLSEEVRGRQIFSTMKIIITSNSLKCWRENFS